MRARRRAFALIIVLIAIAAVFALTLRAATIARSGIIETSATRDRLTLERVAGVGAVLALDAYLPATDGFRAQAGGENSPAQPSTDPEEPDKNVELPDFLIEMVPELAKVEQQAREDLPFDRGDIDSFPTESTTTRSRSEALARLRSAGLPNQPVRIDLDEFQILVEFEDLAGLLDLNTADRDTIVRLLRQLDFTQTLASRLASQIVDWRDADSFRNPGGAERDDYRPFGVEPRNAPFVTAEELLYLPDMNQDHFDVLAPYIGFSSGGTTPISLAAAPEPVLSALPGFSAETVAAINDARSERVLTESLMEELMPSRAADDNSPVQFTHELSGRLRAHIRVIDPESGSIRSRFTAVLLVGEQSSKLVAIRPE